MHHYVGLSGAEIADALGLSPGTVRSRLHYARQEMRAALEADARLSPRRPRMNPHNRADQAFESWLVDGPTRMPEHLVDSIVTQLEEDTSAEARWLPGREQMNRMMVAVAGSGCDSAACSARHLFRRARGRHWRSGDTGGYADPGRRRRRHTDGRADPNTNTHPACRRIASAGPLLHRYSRDTGTRSRSAAADGTPIWDPLT